MKKNTQSKVSPTLTHVMHVWNNVSHSSYQRLNGAMYSALKNAIKSGMRFNATDLVTLAGETRMDRWWGDGERLYGLACGSDRGTYNLSASAAFECHFGRKPWLWAERIKTPERLYVGFQFNWKGERIHVTSFDDSKQSLTACSYNNDDQEDDSGIIYCFNEYRKLEYRKQYEDGTIVGRFSGPAVDHARTIKRRFTITYEQLMAERKAYDIRRRTLEKAIAAAATLEALDAVAITAGEMGTTQTFYRHFDLDILRAAFAKRRTVIKENMSRAEREDYELKREAQVGSDMARWVAGEDVRRHFTAIRVRIKNNRIEVSNGNSVTLEAGRATLAFALKHRRKGWQANGKESPSVDGFRIDTVHPTDGVTIGCTRFEWPEVDRFQGLLK